MPTTFNHAAEVPPAPYVLVTVARLDGTAVAADLPAKVDSGAARTILPYILLRRDVLNQFRIVLDGPNGKLEIG